MTEEEYKRCLEEYYKDRCLEINLPPAENGKYRDAYLKHIGNEEWLEEEE